MIKAITKIGNSRGIILDSALLELANLKEGDTGNITVHSRGTISMTPEVATVDPAQAKQLAANLIAKNNQLFDRLSK